MKHTGHIIRFIIILAVVGIAFIGVRSFLVPESFGIHGSYANGFHRGASDAEQAARPAQFQGTEKCSKCHEKQSALVSSASHATVPCETCHGPWMAHNNNTPETMKADGTIESCMLCHASLTARPADFAQIKNIQSHLTEQESEYEQGMTCLECHDPHEPM
ncbi:MAG: hypothetical protein GY868_20745 [Deltaproteobacteria bacterium]|nr:hypothetical protein [Deltaproteobacteria bacterium]